MNEQRERPEGLATLAAMRAIPGARVSGGQIQNFREGWAFPIMAGRKARAHHFERSTLPGWDFMMADALCGYSWPIRGLYGAGNKERCKRCAALLARQPTSATK
jgi:hypothetical protein